MMDGDLQDSPEFIEKMFEKMKSGSFDIVNGYRKSRSEKGFRGLMFFIFHRIFAIIKRLNKEQGVTMLLVEQNAKVALDVADYGYVMELGRIVIDGEAAKLRASKDIQEFYLGASTDGQRDQKRWKQKKTWR